MILIQSKKKRMTTTTAPTEPSLFRHETSPSGRRAIARVFALCLAMLPLFLSSVDAFVAVVSSSEKRGYHLPHSSNNHVTGGFVAVVPRSQQQRCSISSRRRKSSCSALLLSSNWNNNGQNNMGNNDQDSNQWRSYEEEETTAAAGTNSAATDWQDVMAQKQDGSYWSAFEPSADEDSGAAGAGGGSGTKVPSAVATSEEMEAEAWLDTLAALSAEEVQFNLKEADRADKVRQMEEWGFDSDTIANTLNVATDTALEVADDVTGMQSYREESYLDDVDLETVESHTQVDVDPDTGDPVRSQMVYVDEHTCIGCTHCATISPSTFYMNSEHGRARVFRQWGDDDETIATAIECCPVNCIHYVPYEELVQLEVGRREQNINFKARLVSQAENGNTLSHAVGGPNQFTQPQRISGNMKPRCSNCPSRGCGDCPMYGVGKNPVYEKKEKERQQRLAKRRLQEQREREQKSAEL